MPHRYFTTEIADGTAVLRGTDAHHLARVMRARMGDTVILCDGSAVEYTATITGFGDDCVEFSVEPGYPSAAEPSVEVTLLAGYPKQDKLEQIIQHGVELGIATGCPAGRSEHVQRAARMARDGHHRQDEFHVQLGSGRLDLGEPHALPPARED